MGNWQACTTDSKKDVWKIHINWLLTTLCKLRAPSDLGLGWELVNRLPKIQIEAEFSIQISEHLVDFSPSSGTRNKAHSGKGPFRSSYKTLTKLFSLHRKSHQNLSLLNFKYAARISTPRRTPIHKRARMRAGNFENDPCNTIKGT